MAFQTSGPTLWEGDSHRRKAGLLLGLASALSFSASLLVAAPVMAHGADPICATAIRAFAGSLATFIPAILLRRNRQQMMELTPRIALQVIGSGILGTGVGLTAQLYALKNGPVGVVSALSSTTPVAMLPLVWAASRQRPTAMAWIGAGLAVLGIAVISLFGA